MITLEEINRIKKEVPYVMIYCNKILFNEFIKNTGKTKNKLIFKDLQKNNLLNYMNSYSKIISNNK